MDLETKEALKDIAKSLMSVAATLDRMVKNQEIGYYIKEREQLYQSGVVKEWCIGVTYRIGDKCRIDGDIYFATHDHISSGTAKDAIDANLWDEYWGSY